MTNDKVVFMLLMTWQSWAYAWPSCNEDSLKNILSEFDWFLLLLLDRPTILWLVTGNHLLWRNSNFKDEPGLVIKPIQISGGRSIQESSWYLEFRKYSFSAFTQYDQMITKSFLKRNRGIHWKLKWLVKIYHNNHVQCYSSSLQSIQAHSHL